MFYSETLLQKTGPLAKVWLAANVERKLSKGDCLKTNIEKDVRNIVNTNQAPLALRLTSQLLLGVVRIYSRKARYLLDDCNEALMKIKLAFLPGNVDLPTNQSHVANPAALTLPDTINELDLFAPIPDPTDYLLGPNNALDADQTILDWGTSQILPETLEEADEEDVLLDDGIDLELEYDAPTDIQEHDRSIEAGRRAESIQPDRFDNTTVLDVFGDAPLSPSNMDDVQMPDYKHDHQGVAPVDTDPRHHRESLSPLSDIAPEMEQELEQTFQLEQPEDDTVAQDDNVSVQAQQQRVKRRKVIQIDTTTELNNSQIRALQDDHTRTMKEPTYLPSDPMLLALMNMQRTGGFVSNILGNGRSVGWAPELRGVLSLDIVRRAGDLKRKRIVSREQSPVASLREELVQDDQQLAPIDNEPFYPIDADDEPEQHMNMPSPGPNFDETTVPLVHPADSGPVSLGTKHAVHMLREQFGRDTDGVDADMAPPSPGSRASRSVLFTDLCPESRTTKRDATKLFFEALVLGTKDAIKVEQTGDVLGGPIRIRGKRGLWGSWAETGVSQGLSQGAEAEIVDVHDDHGVDVPVMIGAAA